MRKDRKKGISLIILILTIVVMLILAGIVMQEYISTNVKRKAKETTFKENYLTYNEELGAYLVNLKMQSEDFDPSSVNYSGEQMRISIPSMKNKDLLIYDIIKGRLILKETAGNNEKQWGRELGIDIAGENFDPGAPSFDDIGDVTLNPLLVPATSAPATTAPPTLAPPSVAPATSAPATTAPPTTAPPTTAPPSVSQLVIDAAKRSQLRKAMYSDTAIGYTKVGTTAGGSPIYGATNARIAQSYYGKKVNYSANGVDDWEIIFIDYNFIWIISSEVVPYTTLPGYKESTGTGSFSKVSGSDYRVGYSTSTVSEAFLPTNVMLTESFISEAVLSNWGLNTSATENGWYKKKTSTTTLTNPFKYTLYLLNEAYWKNFVNADYKGYKAYGGPTVQFLRYAINDYYGMSIAVAYNSYGYQISSGWTENSGSDTKYCYIPERANNVFAIKDSNKASFYLIASPSWKSADYIFGFASSGMISSMYSTKFTYAGVRPLVVLDGGAVLTWNATTNKFDIS